MSKTEGFFMSENRTYIIGSDIGTSSTKSISLGIDGKVKMSFQRAYSTSHPAPGYSEQNAAEILQAVKDGIREIVQKTGYPPAAISFSSAMHSLLAMDTAGKLLTPLIIWADNRSQENAVALRNSPAGAEIYRSTGTPVHAMSPLNKIIWLKKYQPDIFLKTTTFLGIKEYVIFQLTGQLLTDHSIASATGLFDIHTLTWNELALKTAGITAAQLPLPVPADYVITGLQPAIAAELGIPADTPIVIGGSDGCLAQLGSDALDEGHATLTIGTSSAIRMAIPQAATDRQQRLFTYLLTDNIYITGGASNNGGILLQWLVKDFLNSQQPVDNLIKEALALPPDKLLCMPYLLGERAPIWDSNASAGFVGIGPEHTAPHFVRAVLESICFVLLSISKALEETAGPIRKVSVSGGFTQSPGWIQLMADIFGKPMTLKEESDASTLGAIKLAAQTLGIPVDFPETIAPVVFYPGDDYADFYQRKFKAYEELYSRLKNWQW
ncbi:gluconokinase [Chitinophaga sp. Cy-1792]|uniref:gluconokinase n=1 Tax=Chitinophaga sp. Cy-1792 TaxID=2608339 RepID=UPI00141F9C43|nr:gluconokinase [Chitinophaga sp. Cy-1792]NIG52347.1 gluconokinase [Chitinophaga sp. Cy-1792]